MVHDRDFVIFASQGSQKCAPDPWTEPYQGAYGVQAGRGFACL
jgi:hypothetical protein